MNTSASALTPAPRHPSQLHATALSQHMAECLAQRSHWRLTALLAEAAHAAVAPRFVTTVAAIGGGMALAFGWL